jgi:hypothetical protein
MTAEIRHQFNPNAIVWVGTHYVMRSRYGKYTIYKWDYLNFKRTSTTLAKGLDKETAIGMMKLLKEPNETD